MTDKTLELVGRDRPLFEADLATHGHVLREIVGRSRFLVIGGAGTIGQAVVRELFRRKAAALHVVDLSENNLVELVRDIRSSMGYIDGDFRTLPLDVDSLSFHAFVASEKPYDYVLNLSALKHVRSEKDPYTLMRMIDVNVFNALKLANLASGQSARNYFAVSTDKAANPANLMGATKRIMERMLVRASRNGPISMARFANVAFSDGSLLHSFGQRMRCQQPIVAPNDVQRFFITERESGELCLISALLGESLDVFFPKLETEHHALRFSDIAVRFLEQAGYEPVECKSEEEARNRVAELAKRRKWPVYFFASNTSGEKSIEEFFIESEIVNLGRFEEIGVIRMDSFYDEAALDSFSDGIERIKRSEKWRKPDIESLIKGAVPEMNHIDTGRFLDGRM